MALDLTIFTLGTLQKFVLHGIYLSLILTAIGAVGGFFLGSLLTVVRLYGPRWSSYVVIAYVDGVRSVPLLMVLLGIYLLLPHLLGRGIDAAHSAAITFVLFEAAYYAEIIRSGLTSIPEGQMKAGRALGFSTASVVGRILMPQVFRSMLPVLLTQTIILFQATSLVYIVSAYDALKGFENAGRYFGDLGAGYLAAAIFYLIVCYSLSLGVGTLQRKVQIKR